MFSKKNQTKVSPEQRKKQEDLEKEQKRKGIIIKDSIYPLLVNKAESVEDAKIFLQTMSLVVEQSFMNLKQKMKVKELEIDEHMKGSVEAERYKEFYGILKDENVIDAMDLLSSMNNLIQNNEREEMKKKAFADLPIRFITYGDTSHS